MLYSKCKKVLGLSAFYHDSAAALVIDGDIVAAAQEERFTRKKHDPRFPANAINYCLEEAFLDVNELDAIVFYDHPVKTLDRAFCSVTSSYPDSAELWEQLTKSFSGQKLFTAAFVRKALKTDAPVLFAEHHASHAASAFYPSPFSEAAILTMDGVGEWATTTLGVGDIGGIRLLEELSFPHSLGLLYSAFTVFCGFKVNSGEYKLMGLAPYGTPIYADKIRDELIDIRPDGSFHLNMKYFAYVGKSQMVTEEFSHLFGGPERPRESRITRREMDLAASVQAVTEEIVCLCAQTLRERTGKKHLVMAGGVALNCVANGILLRRGIFDDIWIQPAAGDAGGALGAALLVSHDEFKVPRKAGLNGRDRQRGSYLGPCYSAAEIAAFIERNDINAQHVPDEEHRARTAAQALADGKVVGHFSGRMEFGPRALGARSILGDPRSPKTQSVMNLKIKYRESFRPFAPSVLAEKCQDYFELDRESPYMLLVAPVRASRRVAVPVGQSHAEDMLPVINQVRSDIPAVTHVDYSARIQTVNKNDNPAYYRLIAEFEKITGYGVIVNTSFNVRGEPIVCTPEDAYRCFMRTEMDLLVLEDTLVWKSEQPITARDDSWKEEFELD